MGSGGALLDPERTTLCDHSHNQNWTKPNNLQEKHKLFGVVRMEGSKNMLLTNKR